MKKFIIIAMLMLLIAPAFALPDVYDQLRGRQMVGDVGAPWFADSAVNYFGTGKDVALTYNPTSDKFFVNDTDVYLEEDVTIAGNLAVSGSTISNGKTTDPIWVDDLFYVTDTAALNATTVTTLVTSGDSYLNGTTVGTSDTLAVTTADKLTVGSVIVPQEIVLTIPIGASEVDQTAFIADDAWQITKIEEVHSVAQNTAYPNTGSLSVMKCTGTQAPGSGAALHNTTMYLNSTVETVVTPTLNAATGALNLADGNRIGLNFNGTMTTFAGGCVTIHMKRI